MVAEPIRNCCFCHCESCRRATGASPVAWGTVYESEFKILCGEISVRRSSPEVQRGFCAQCGTSLTYRHVQRVGEVDFTLSSLDTADAIEPRMHVWVQDKLSWINVNDGRPRFDTVPGQENG
jgi:hypothetical protein